MAQDRRALQRVIKTAQNIIGTHLPSISDIGEVPAQSPKFTTRQYLPQPQPVHPAAIWQVIQKYLLLYHQTTEQRLSSGCEIPKLILHTPP